MRHATGSCAEPEELFGRAIDIVSPLGAASEKVVVTTRAMTTFSPRRVFMHAESLFAPWPISVRIPRYEEDAKIDVDDEINRPAWFGGIKGVTFPKFDRVHHSSILFEISRRGFEAFVPKAKARQTEPASASEEALRRTLYIYERPKSGLSRGRRRRFRS
ncbi:hypothetical protein CYMTET_41718 [Cymbomonas tetramitiformis]|uniref:Uncharacterized protein n=1 Tax=Cymbomonas tetramitiformis TaxID=36881 RepID=A0AAE0C6U7_9CHLO|nr:hypothetical protein CYMTET_41718 [Cymbomonas tetramitiformis]